MVNVLGLGLGIIGFCHSSMLSVLACRDPPWQGQNGIWGEARSPQDPGLFGTGAL
jgi:hypothetical protein